MQGRKLLPMCLNSSVTYVSESYRAAFFSLVFFAGQRKVTGSPRRGMSYGPWVQKPSPTK